MECKVTIPRRQAMLRVTDREYDCMQVGVVANVVAHVPVLVWPMPDIDGRFVVEHEDGTCSKAWPHELKFLDSKELFDSYCWDIPHIEIGCV